MMKTYYNLVLVRHDNCHKIYTFFTEPPVDISAGERLLVDTILGQKQVTAVSDSFLVDDRGLHAITMLSGARLPLRPVIGRVKTEIVPLTGSEASSSTKSELPY